MVFWKVCTRCEYQSLCNSRQYWQRMNKKSFKFDRGQKYSSRLRKGRMSALNEKHENAINGKQRFCVRKGMLAVSVTTTVSVERKHNRPLVLQGHRHKMTEEGLRKEVHGSSPSGRTYQRACRNYLTGNWTNPSCDYWHRPVCQNYKSESGCNSGTLRLRVSPAKSRRKVVVMVLLLY